jgi:TRAP-type C4-dicarboxylate transport system substrate-binding protein
LKKIKLALLISSICLTFILATLPLLSCTQAPTTPAPTTPAPTTPAPTTPAPTTKTTVLRVALYAPPIHDMVIDANEIFPAVEKCTGGRVKVEIYDSQKLCTLGETLDALNRGLADIASFPLPVFQSTDMPWFHAYLVPGLIKDLQGANQAANYGLIDIYQEAFHSAGLKIKIVRMFSPGCTVLITTKRVAVPEDLKGVKIACASGAEVDLMEVLGASPIAMSHPDAYEGMMRGLVDGTLGAVQTMTQYKFQEPCDYLLMQGFGAPIVATLVSEQALAKLSEADQAIVIELAKQFALSNAYKLATAQDSTIRAMTPELKEVIYPTEEQSQKWSEALAPYVDGFMEEGGDEGRQIIDIIRKYNP